MIQYLNTANHTDEADTWVGTSHNGSVSYQKGNYHVDRGMYGWWAILDRDNGSEELANFPDSKQAREACDRHASRQLIQRI